MIVERRSSPFGRRCGGRPDRRAREHARSKGALGNDKSLLSHQHPGLRRVGEFRAARTAHIRRAAWQADVSVALMRRLWLRELKAFAEGGSLKDWRRPDLLWADITDLHREAAKRATATP